MIKNDKISFPSISIQGSVNKNLDTKPPATVTFKPTCTSVGTQTNMENQAEQQNKTPFRTMLALTIVLFLSSFVMIVIQIVSYSTINKDYPYTLTVLDLAGIAIWGSVIFTLASGALVLIDLYKIKKICPKVMLTTIILSALVSCIIACLAVYSASTYDGCNTLPNYRCSIHENQNFQRTLAGIMAFASMSSMVSSVFLAACIGRTISVKKPDILPNIIHYTATSATMNERL